MKIGRYEIKFGRYFWIQTKAPTTAWPFLCFTIFKEARPSDVDKKKQFPLDTLMEHEGRTFRYWKAPKDVVKGELVRGEDKE
ncbi:hypothetical protein ES703_123809 [subsurface metagenome]